MSSRRSRRSSQGTAASQLEEGADENEELNLNNDSPPTAKKASKQRKNKRKSSSSSSFMEMEADDFEEDEDMGGREMTFSSQIPELSQDIASARPAERNKMMGMNEEAREKAIADLLKMVLFKGLAGEPIDRKTIVKDVGISDFRISSAAFLEVNERLENMFDFKLVPVPAFMLDMKELPNKYRDRYYLKNLVDENEEDEYGSHAKALHSTSKLGCIEKSFLMVVLGFIYCKGTARSNGSRWLLDKDLYALLNKVDENIHSEPPLPNQKRTKRGRNNDLDADAVLAKFVAVDYLWAVKASTDEELMQNKDAEETSVFYSLGPRTMVEVGRVQIIQFCGECLDEEPDQSFYVLEVDFGTALKQQSNRPSSVESPVFCLLNRHLAILSFFHRPSCSQFTHQIAHLVVASPLEAPILLVDLFHIACVP